MRTAVALGISLLVLVVMTAPTAALDALAAAPAGAPGQQAVVNKLNAVVNNLDSIQARLDDVLAHPPEPGKPAANGAVGRLRAMAGQLGVLYDRVSAAQPPPDDNTPPPDDIRVQDALRNVRDGARGIVVAIDNQPPPDDIRVQDALDGVRAAAEDLVDLADALLRDIGGGGPIGGDGPIG